MADVEGPSYHDLHITTEKIERTSIFNLPYGFQLQCQRTTGWVLWDTGVRFSPHLKEQEPGEVAGEYGDNWLVLDVDGHVILDSRNRPPEPEDVDPEPESPANELFKETMGVDIEEWNDNTVNIARAFHDAYEEAAAARGWATQERSRVPFDQLPPENRETMLVTVGSLLTRGVIKPGDNQFSYGSFEWFLRPIAPIIALARQLQDQHLDGMFILVPPTMLEPFTEVYGMPLRRMEGITVPVLAIEGPDA
jgi:hypothetical protein